MMPKQLTVPEMPTAKPPGTTERGTGIIWYCCPVCGQKIFKIKKDAKACGIEVKCKKCRNIINVSL